MQDDSKIKITVDKSHLFTLGEKMYRESIEFVRELVNNAYDADATKVLVLISDNKIVVQDNGSGMDEKGLSQFFTIGSPEKQKHNLSPRFGRKRIGQFGIGKFSALALADQFIIESVKKGKKYYTVFDRTSWQSTEDWSLPVKKNLATSLDMEGTKVILNNLTKKISFVEVEKYLRQSVPLRARKFNVLLNNKRITSKIVTGKIFPINIKTMYGAIDGEIIIALNARDVDEPGIECRVKQVFVKREKFGLENAHIQGTARITGFVNADFLPLIVARSDFVIDSPEYSLFFRLMRVELEKVLGELKKHSETKNLKKITKELNEVMKQLRGALLLNPDFAPKGRAAARLKKEGKIKIAASSVNLPENSDRKDNQDGLDKKENKNTNEKNNPVASAPPFIEAKPMVMKRVRVNKLGVSCGIVSLGENGPEAASQGNAVYINQDYLLYKKFYKRKDLFNMYLLRLLTQEIVKMKKVRLNAEEAFKWQNQLLKDALK